LAEAFVAWECRRLGFPEKMLVPDAVKLLSAMPWRGNAEELREVIDALIEVTAESVHIRLEDVLKVVELDATARAYMDVEPLRVATRRFERDFIRTALGRCRGRMGPTAEIVGIQRPNLYRKMRSLGLPQGPR
jgi:two-component system nitrogen regulation response regulator NtrX